MDPFQLKRRTRYRPVWLRRRPAYHQRGSHPAGGSEHQYLYYNSSQPHELTGLYTSGATCSNKTRQVYATSYGGFGNVSNRTFSSTTGTLTYDTLNHFTEWNAGATSQEWYVYDGAGQHVLRRSTDGTTTSLTVYAFGREEHSYTSTGSNQGNTYYYTLAGHLVGKSDGGSVTFYQTDLLGSVVADWSNTAGSAAVKGNEVYGPYGKQRYNQGTHGTPKGFTGQYNDSLTGLDYYNARYYDPVVGVFLSADSTQGNMQGMNPYAYVNGNPETYSDPTGQIGVPLYQVTHGQPGASMPGWGVIGLFIIAAPVEAPVEATSAVATGVVAAILGLAWLFGQINQSSTSRPVQQPSTVSGIAISVQPHISGIAINIQPHTSGSTISSQPPSSPPQTQTGSSGGGLIPLQV